MRVITIPVWTDNYAYLCVWGRDVMMIDLGFSWLLFYHNTRSLHSIASKNGTAAAIDPVDVTKVRQVARENGLTIRMVLTTHAHR